MSAAMQIAQYLVDRGVGTRGGTLFVGNMPDTPDDCVSVLEYAGLPPERIMSASAGAFIIERPKVQVVSRAATYNSAHSRAYSAFVELDGLGGVTLSGNEILMVECLQSPFYFFQDENEREIFVFNAQVQRRKKT